MRKVKPYNFKGVDCYDLNSLAEEYIKSYFEAIDDIFTNAKALIKFVKRCRKDKDFTKEIAEILYTSKYKNNALTFIIFAFTGYGRIVINGVEMSFKEFLEAFKQHKNEDNNVLNAFIEDAGISKTFANVMHDDRLTKEAAAIEANYDLPFTRLYLESYYSFKEKSSYENRISNLIIDNEECFRKATELFKEDDFHLAIAHKMGFKEAAFIHKELNPVFESVKLLKQTNEFQDEELLKLITDTFYWWLLDNIDRYIPKSKDANALFKKIDGVATKYKKYKDLIKKKKIYNLAIESMADMSKEMYAYYLEFVTLYRRDEIIVKKKFKGSYDYVFDKPYCHTFITQNYMDGRIITIDPLKEEEPAIEPVEEPTDENTEGASEGKKKKQKEKKVKEPKAKKAKKVKKSKKELKEEQSRRIEHHEDLPGASDDVDIIKLRKKNSKNGRGKSFIRFELFIIIVGVAAIITTEALKYTDLGLSVIYSSQPVFYGFIGAVVLLLILLPILSHKVKQSFKSSINIEYIQNTKKVEALTIEQEKKLSKLKPYEEKNTKQVKRANTVLYSLILACVGLISACLGLMAIVLLKDNQYVKDYLLIEKLTEVNMLYAIATGAGVGLVYGFIKKYKGILSILLVNVLSIAAAVAVLIFL